MTTADSPRISRRQRRTLIVIGLLLASWIGWAAITRVQARLDPVAAPAAVPTAVEVVELQEQAYAVTRRYRGSLEAERRAVVSARLTAPVLEVLHWEGSAVGKHASLMRLDPTESEQEVARLDAVAERIAAELRMAHQNQTRQEALHARDLTPEHSLDEARQRVEMLEAQQKENRAALALAHTRLGYAEARAPFAGIIQRVYAKPGEMAAAGKPLVELVASEPLKAVIAVPQAEAAAMTPGLAVRLEVPALRRSWVSTLARVHPILEPGTRNAMVEAFIPATGTPLRPGMAVEALITLEQGAGLPVPTHAVHNDAQGAFVWTVRERTVRRHAVEPGPARDGVTWIRAGLEPGVKVITTPDPRLAEGDPVSVPEPAGPR